MYQTFQLSLASVEVVQTVVPAHQRLPGNLYWVKPWLLMHSDATAWANIGYLF